MEDIDKESFRPGCCLVVWRLSTFSVYVHIRLKLGWYLPFILKLKKNVNLLDLCNLINFSEFYSKRSLCKQKRVVTRVAETIVACTSVPGSIKTQIIWEGSHCKCANMKNHGSDFLLQNCLWYCEERFTKWLQNFLWRKKCYGVHERTWESEKTTHFFL